MNEPSAAGAQDAAGVAWYRRRGVMLAAGVVAIVLVAVLTDLPTTASRAANVAGANAFVKEVNADLAPCDYALAEVYGFRRDQLRGTLTNQDRSELPTLLSDDRVACSLADPSIEDLTTGIESPGTSVQNQLGLMAATVTRWVTPDALSAVLTIETLSTDPTNATAAAKLVRETARLDKDRATARAAIESADHQLAASLYQTSLPSVTVPVASNPAP
jgi:hypothetical protein